MGRRDFDNLVDEIKRNGMLQRLLVNSEGLLLDGRNRLQACYLLRRQLTDQHIEVTDASPLAIANANIARRHLTVDQRVMLAVKVLTQEREKAAERKREGQRKGRENRNSPSGAKRASNQTAKLRNQRAIENVSKKTGVSRADLAKAEKVAKVDPDTAKAVEAGEMPLDEAVKKTGVGVKNKKIKTPNNIKPVHKETDTKSVSTASSRETKFSDSQTTIVDRSDDIRVVAFGKVSIFHHQDLTSPPIIVGDDQGQWWAYDLAEGIRSEAESKKHATRGHSQTKNAAKSSTC